MRLRPDHDPGCWHTHQSPVECHSDSLRLDAPLVVLVPGSPSVGTLEVNSPQGSQLMGNLVQVQPTARPAVVNHYGIQPVIDVYANTQDRDLGAVASATDSVIKSYEGHLPRGTQIVLRGQVSTMRSSFAGLGIGLLGAIILVYLLIVINFQSWLDPFIIISALPGALAG